MGHSPRLAYPGAMRRIGALVLALSSCAPRSERAPISPGFPPTSPRVAAYAAAVDERFDESRALATVAYVDQYFRVRGNEGYQASLAHVREHLLGAGFTEDELRTLELGETRATWTPRSARLALVGQDGVETPLISFERESDTDRATLLVHSDSMSAWMTEVVRIEDMRAGQSVVGRLVLAEGNPGDVYREAVETHHASGIVVRNLESYHRADEHPDAAQFGYLPDDPDRSVVGFSLSNQGWRALRQATEHGAARVRIDVSVVTGTSAATALEVRIEGSLHQAGAVVFSTHVDEPGANDNASGVGALAELATALRSAIDSGAVAPPERTIVFLWGQEIEASGAWLDQGRLPVAVGLVLDMVGEDPATLGAPFRIERMPDPGAVWLRSPDTHSEWGASEVDASALHGHFLNDLLRTAVAAVDARDPAPWDTVAHPFEGGSDHVSFLDRDIPAVLAWHFTDDAYHTTRDRLPRVSGPEMRRVSSALGAAALAMASGARADRLEMLEVVRLAARERLRWADAAARTRVGGGEDRELEVQVIEAWAQWYDDALASVAAWGSDDDLLDGRVTDARREVASLAAGIVGNLP